MNTAARRILCLWFPRLAAERVLRQRADTLPAPFAIVEDRNGAQVLVSVCALASDIGLHIGQGLRDATAICPSLVHRPAHPVAEAAFLASLRRWAGKFTPWVGAAVDGQVGAGRQCYAMELDPVYCDVAVRRWEMATRKIAMLLGHRQDQREPTT